MIYLRLLIFIFGLATLSLGVSITINVQHLGLHPWDVLAVGLYNRFGLTVGTWGIIIGLVLTTISIFLDLSYVKWGTFLNIVGIGLFIDLFLWLDFLPKATSTWLDVVILFIGIAIIGVGGGIYNSVGFGAGPRDGFMLSIADKTGMTISKVRIITETVVLILGWLIGGPVFIFSFFITFIQSPIFQMTYLRLLKLFGKMGASWVRQEETV